jgi:hypothetical protein
VKFFTLLAIVWVFAASTARTQTTQGVTQIEGPIRIKINGLSFPTTQKKLFQVFGKPDSIDTRVYDNGDSICWYSYGSSLFFYGRMREEPRGVKHATIDFESSPSWTMTLNKLRLTSRTTQTEIAKYFGFQRWGVRRDTTCLLRINQYQLDFEKGMLKRLSTVETN